ncbi:Periodic tryptophan protein [Trichinella pseudospiralis]
MNASLSTVTALQQSVNLLRKNLSRICSSNCYTLKYLLDVHNQATDVKVKEEEKQSANNENMNIDDDDDDHILIERADNG